MPGLVLGGDSGFAIRFSFGCIGDGFFVSRLLRDYTMRVSTAYSTSLSNAMSTPFVDY